MLSDEAIVALYWKRDEGAIEHTDKKYHIYCQTVADRILRSATDAEECVNDSYLGAWNAIPPTRPDPLLTYILKIVRNVSLTRYQKNHAQKRNSSYDVAVEELEEFLVSPDSVEGKMELKELTGTIETFLDSLNELNRVIFVRRYWYYDNYMQIAKKVGLSEKNVSVRLTRLRKQLKDYLEERGNFL